MPLEPNQLKVDTEQQRLFLMWDDGTQKDFSHAHLRASCPCGFCRAKRLRQQEVHYPDHVAISAIYSQGYGIQICFDDGHDKGIFPWAFLKELHG
ncbi:gamma-butyrobetaine hydroxylase-like domain-containing protein [Acinetobacter sp. ANC 3882]|uniref:gamma-butyrobetaine hydroxylase-like domain-containing protein n=1 Tax=Acinetobacter sp. ANC 3882 TaxID=2923423 RepID=UPI001F4BC9F8|nr:gamma-butyrobetaine hydroxylase-like domain-containing protein [Acinetobacter sp. ANC 3882]MCH7313727.1 gamma-butyrobetaine hydroxylase-like domain-containing protein [Acinetobacter sp. ANC 3882]